MTYHIYENGVYQCTLNAESRDDAIEYWVLLCTEFDCWADFEDYHPNYKITAVEGKQYKFNL